MRTACQPSWRAVRECGGGRYVCGRAPRAARVHVWDTRDPWEFGPGADRELVQYTRVLNLHQIRNLKIYCRSVLVF